MLPSKKRASKRVSSTTSWIGSVGGQFDDLKVDVDEESRVIGSSQAELKTCLAEARSQGLSDSDEHNVQAAADGLAAMNLTKDSDAPKGPLHASKAPLAGSNTERSASTHTGTRRSSSSGNNANRERLSIFTSHTTTTLVSSTYHSSDLDSFSDEGLVDSDLDSDDESLQPSSNDGESQDGEDDINSLLSSDFDSHDLDSEQPLETSESTDHGASESERETKVPLHEGQTRLGWTPDMRFNTLENSPSVKSDPFASPEETAHRRMISNSSLFVQVADLDNDKVESHPNGKLDYEEKEREYVVPYNDAKETGIISVADALEKNPDSEHPPFVLELTNDLTRNVSGLTVQSAMVGRRAPRATRRGGKRNRPTDTTKNETWTHKVVAKRTINAIPNQPLPPPPPHSETPPLPRRILKDPVPKRQAPQWNRSYNSLLSKVSALSTPTMEDKKSLPRRTDSYAGSFESSWDSTIVSPSPPNAKGIKKLRIDGTASEGPSGHDNPTFHAANRGKTSMDIPPPPPYRQGTPNSLPPAPPDTPDSLISRGGRPTLVNMRALSKASTITFDSAMTTPTIKELNRKNLERLNEQMGAAMGVKSPRLKHSKSSSSNLSIVQRRESVKLLREKLQSSFRSAISPVVVRDRKKKGGSTSVASIPDAPITVLRDSSRSPTRQYRRTARK
ncbi:MAG: hypothetical protein SGBAC_004652 [Bacillariaceae sp.]